MLLHKLRRDEYAQGMQMANVLPDLLPIYYWLKIQLENRFPFAPDSDVYAYPWPNAKYWFLVRRHQFIQPIIQIDRVFEAGFEKNEFLKYLREFVADIRDIWDGEWMLISEGFICDMLTECVKEFTGCEVLFDDHQLYTCYMNPSTQTVISRLELSLPDGYRFLEDDKQAENYTQIVNDTWRNATPKELEQTRAKLRYLPSVIILYGDEAVAFEMSDAAGYQNHLFTLPEHRNKGLGKAVQLRLSQKCISQGIWPFESVQLENPGAIAFAERSPYWQFDMDENGQRRLRSWRQMTLKAKTMI